MANSFPFFLVDSFTSRAFSGNPAAICLLDDALDAPTMQHIASELGFSETAFVVHGDLQLRWFTPSVEIDLCGHATLATSHVLYTQGYRKGQLTYHTKSGELQSWQEGSRIALRFPRRDMLPHEGAAELLSALGLASVVESHAFMSDTHRTVLLQLESVEQLRQLDPDFHALALLRTEVIVTTAAPGSIEGRNPDFVSRFFAPHIGIDEDPVTGAAHCSLGPYWAERCGKDEVLGYQASARGGFVHVKLEESHVVLSGEALVLIEGNFCLSSHAG